MLAVGQRLPLLRLARRAHRDAREGARRRQDAALRRPLARPRSGRRAARREARDPAQGAADRRDRGRGPGPGPRHLAEREPRRFRAAALRRQPDLHAGGGGGRPRHGRDPHHPRRRPPQQRRAADPDLPGARLDRAGDGAHSADPRAGRLQALQAPRRARRRCLPGHGLPAGGDAQLSGAARLEPRRPGNLLDRGDDRGVRPGRRSAARRRASISPSSKASTAITCARAPTAICWRRSTSCCRTCRTAPRSPASSRPRSASRSWRPCPN